MKFSKKNLYNFSYFEIVTLYFIIHFILLSLYNIFFMQFSLSICHCFYKKYFKINYKTQHIFILIINSHSHTDLYINNILSVYLTNQIQSHK